MILARYLEQLREGFSEALSHCNLKSPTLFLALRASFAAVIAIALALILHLDQAYWAGISAMVVILAREGNSFQRMLFRVSATLVGTCIGLILVSSFITDPPILYLAVFFATTIGIYMSIIDKEHMYIWLLGYITMLMVVLYNLLNPTPNNLVETGFFRCAEICLGAITAYVICKIFQSKSAGLKLEKELRNASTKLVHSFSLFHEVILSPQNQDHATFEKNAIATVQNLEMVYESWQTLQYESRRNSPKNYQYSARLNAMHNAFELIVTQYRLLDQHSFAYMAAVQPELHGFYEKVSEVLQCFCDVIHGKSTEQELTAIIDAFIERWNILKQKILQNRQDGINCQHKMEEVDHVLELIMTARLIVLEIRDSLEPEICQNQSYKLKYCPWYTRLLNYDSFFIKHAMIGSFAILLGPFIWLLFALPGYAQIAVSVAAVIGMDPDATRYKAFLRILGCATGAVAVILVLSLDIQDLPIILLLTFLICSAFAYIHFSNAKISYIGTQAIVVFFISIFHGFAPTTSMLTAYDRLIGIIGGVCCVLIFQHLFWSYRSRDRLLHYSRQIKLQLYPMWTLYNDFLNGDVKENWRLKPQVLAETRLELRQLKTISDNETINKYATELYEAQRNTLRQIYSLLLISQHLVTREEIKELAPMLHSSSISLCKLFTTPVHSASQRDEAIKEAKQLKQHLDDLRKTIRAERTLANESVILNIEAITSLNCLRRIFHEQIRVYRIYQQLLSKEKKLGSHDDKKLAKSE